MRTDEAFARWAEACEIPYEPLLQFQPQHRDVLEAIENAVVEKLKTEHEMAPKYTYGEEPSDKVLSASEVPVVNLGATYIKGARKGQTILLGKEAAPVEALVARHFEQHGYEVLSAESKPLHVLVACLLYPVISDASDPLVEPAYFGDRHAFERGLRGPDSPKVCVLLPEDFGSHGYGSRRAAAIAARLRVLGESTSAILRTFDDTLTQSEPLRQFLWAHEDSSSETARRFLQVVPCDQIVSILKYLVSNYWERYLGWPDLLVCRPDEYFFAEVKGSGDRLSEDQKRWVKDNAQLLRLPFKLVKVHRKATVEPPSA